MNGFNGMQAQEGLNQELGKVPKEETITVTVNNVTVTVTINWERQLVSVEAHDKQLLSPPAQQPIQSTQPKTSIANEECARSDPKKFAYHWSHDPEYGEVKDGVQAMKAAVHPWPRVNGHLDFDPRMLRSYEEFQDALKKQFHMKHLRLEVGELVHLRVAGSKPRARRTFTVVNASSWEGQIVPMFKKEPEESMCIVFGARRKSRMVDSDSDSN